MFEHVGEEQPSRLLGRGTFLGGNEVCHVTTLTLGSRPKQRGYKVADQEKARESRQKEARELRQEEAQESRQEKAQESHHTLSGV
jgi:hypothetical protein